MLSYSATLIFDTFHKALTMCRHGDVLVFLGFFFFHDASAQLRFSVPAFQVSFYEKKQNKIKKCCALTILLYHLNISINRFFPASPFPVFIGKTALGGILSISRAQRGREKKNKNLNKYFIRLFCDLMCFCSAEVWGNISAPFINALPQAYPTIV